MNEFGGIRRTAVRNLDSSPIIHNNTVSDAERLAELSQARSGGNKGMIKNSEHLLVMDPQTTIRKQSSKATPWCGTCTKDFYKEELEVQKQNKYIPGYTGNQYIQQRKHESIRSINKGRHRASQIAALQDEYTSWKPSDAIGPNGIMLQQKFRCHEPPGKPHRATKTSKMPTRKSNQQQQDTPQEPDASSDLSTRRRRRMERQAAYEAEFQDHGREYRDLHEHEHRSQQERRPAAHREPVDYREQGFRTLNELWDEQIAFREEASRAQREREREIQLELQMMQAQLDEEVRAYQERKRWV